MICPRCGSHNTHTQISTYTDKFRKGHSCLWWIFIGWWWRLIWLVIFGIWYIIFRIIVNLIPNSTRVFQEVHHICDDCGFIWK